LSSVLLVTQDLQAAGAQRQCVELALGLARTAGWEVAVAALEPGGPLRRELDAAGIAVHDCPRRWRWDLSPARAIASLVRRCRYDLVHTFLFLPNFYGRLARLRTRPRALVSSLRSTGIEGWPRYAAEILLAPLCDRIIANSDAGRGDLVAHGVSPRRIVVVRNGLDLSRFERAAATAPSAADGCRRIGMIAQMESRKDHVGLVRAFALVLKRAPDMCLVLAGDGRLRSEVEECISRLGLGERVDLLGTVERPEDVHASLAVYVQASASEEGTSNSILEAMASARPVVATDVGGNREVVRHGETGLVVPPRDPVALADAVSRLLEHPEEARRMGQAGAALARERYSRDVMVAGTLDVYRSLLGDPKRTHP
jgi:glycosyltransferase involved in cell wall biosynthesis